MMKKEYQGIVKDQLSAGFKKTRYYSTYSEAHAAAEKLCRKSWGDRATIEVREIYSEGSRAKRRRCSPN